MKKLMSILLALTLVLSLASVAFAGVDGQNVQPYLEKNGNHVTLHVNSTDSWQPKVNALLADEENELVTVLFDDLVKEDFPDFETVSPRQIGPVVTRYIKNTRTAADYIGKTVIAVDRGEPGSVSTISVTKSIATTINNTYSCPINLITLAVGWSVTGSTAITVANAKRVPITHNGKQVKAGTLKATAIYKVKKFDVWQGIQGTSNEKKLGTGDSKKAYGANFYMTYEYK